MEAARQRRDAHREDAGLSVRMNSHLEAHRVTVALEKLG